METRSSTAKALAIYDIPGLDTVHCWSNVRSRVDCGNGSLLLILKVTICASKIFEYTLQIISSQMFEVCLL